jgi:Ca-activated chloride channel family protein
MDIIPQIEFSLKYINLMILLLGLVVMLYFISKKYARKRVLRFGNFPVLQKVAGKRLFSTSLIPLGVRIIAVLLLVALLSDVVVIKDEYVSKTDFILAIDTSSSMLTEDYEPNRIEFVKETAISFISRLKNTQVGLITFAGKAHVRLKPTSDMSAVESELRGIDYENPAGTAIGDALVVADSLFDDSTKKLRNQSIIIITDGRNNVGRNITDALATIKERNTTVYAIGIGSKVETETTIPANLVGLNATAAKFPNLDEGMLQLIANSTKGQYFIIDDEGSFKNAFETGLDYTKVKSEQDKIIVLALCVILLIDWALEITKVRVVP